MLKSLPKDHLTDLLEGLLNTAPQAILILDQTHCVRCWNPMAEKIFGISKGDAINTPVEDLLNVNFSEGLICFDDKQTSSSSLAEVQIEQTAQPITIDHQDWCIVYLTDVTVRREQERRLANEALTDPLSGLSNRRGFQDKLESALSKKLTLAIIDTDHFKQVNDQFGHEAGDLAIQTLSKLLVQNFPDAITHSRLGGDEFGVVMETQSQAKTVEAFDQFRRQVNRVKLGPQAFSITVSIGVALSNVAGTTARELLTTADRSMYQAKEAGRDQVAIQPINV